MTTALDIIKRSIRLLGVYSVGEEPSADEAQDALTALNSMLDSWANDNLLVYAKTLDSVPLIAGQSSFTMGPTGSVVTTRPVFVDEASYIVYQNVSYPLEKLTLSDYNEIGLKTNQSGIPTSFWCLMNYPNITVTLWPVVADSMTMNVWSNKLITSFASLTTTIELPPGYQRLIEYALAEELAPEYEVPVPIAVASTSAKAKRSIKRTNTQSPLMSMPYGIPGGNYGGYYL